MEYKHTIEDIEKHTGLTYPYIRKCNKRLKDILIPFITYGNKNILLYDSNALVIFDQIKQLKESGLNLNEIESKLLVNQSSNSTQSSLNKGLNSVNPDHLEIVLSDLRESNKAIISAKDEALQYQNRVIRELESKIQLLTDGRDPEILKKEQMEKELEHKNNLTKLSESKFLIQQQEIQIKEMKASKEVLLEEYKKKEIEKDLSLSENKKQMSLIQESLQNKEIEVLKFKEDQEKLEKEFIEKENKRKNILLELKAIEGKWLVGSKRKKLLEELNLL